MINTIQDLLNVSAKHVITQGKGALEPEHRTCSYRTADGLSCAASPFIINYKPEMERKGFVSVARRFPEDVHKVAEFHAEFVAEVLQVAHDGAALSTMDSPFLDLYRYRLKVEIITWNARYPERQVSYDEAMAYAQS